MTKNAKLILVHFVESIILKLANDTNKIIEASELFGPRLDGSFRKKLKL